MYTYIKRITTIVKYLHSKFCCETISNEKVPAIYSQHINFSDNEVIGVYHFHSQRNVVYRTYSFILRDLQIEEKLSICTFLASKLWRLKIKQIKYFEKGHHWFITQNLCGRGNKDKKVYFILRMRKVLRDCIQIWNQ